ncbi:MAG: ABC transporter ATP-binding protein [Bdellovibrio sp.]|nr:ABC transporter ATP-binding protein [Bdellovibrio sp.]
MTVAVQFQEVTKFYLQHLALQNVNLEITSGTIHGLLGPNGAGKSTILRLVSGLLAPSKGKIFVDGLDVTQRPSRFRGLIGLLGENAPLYPQMTVLEYLHFVGKLFEIQNCKNKIDELIGRLALEGFLNRPNRTLSKGQRQRVGLAQALLPDPKILILDEPTSGLDPQMAMEFRETIKVLRGDKTIILSGHILSEIEMMADEVTILHKGVVLETGSLSLMRNKFKLHTILEIATKEFPDDLEAALLQYFQANCEIVHRSSEEVRWRLNFFEDKDHRHDVAQFLLERKIVPLELKAHHPSLEEVFKQVIDRRDNALGRI